MLLYLELVRFLSLLILLKEFIVNHARLPILAALLLALFISGCSRTPVDLTAPTLEPQFGTAADDYGIDVALGGGGQTYVLALEYGVTRDEFVYGEYKHAFLRRYDRLGNLLGSKRIARYACDDSGYEDCSFTSFGAHALHADGVGNTYALLSYGSVVDDSAYADVYSLYKMDAKGNVVMRVKVGTTGYGFGGDNVEETLTTAVDARGNLYVAKVQYDYNYSDGWGSYRNLIAKYSTNGALLWQRTSTVGTPKGVAVSSTGTVFVVGSSGISRYSSSGTLNWTKSGGGDDITVSGSNVYVRKGTTIRKHDSSGKQLWSKAQGGLSGMVIADMTADGNGNVYLTGKYAKTSTNRDAFFRKLSGSGSVVWTKVFGTSKYDDARGIATLNGSEIYVTGSTQGTLSHPNMGGSDGYLRKMDGSGNRVWTR